MSSLDMTLMADMAQQQDITLKDTIMSPVAALDGVPLASVNGDLDAKHVDSAPEVPTASPTPLTLPSYVDAQQLQTAAMMATAMMSYHQALNLFGVTPSPFGTSLDASFATTLPLLGTVSPLPSLTTPASHRDSAVAMDTFLSTPSSSPSLHESPSSLSLLTELPLAPTFDLPMERSHSVASSILMSSGTSTGLGSANSSYPSSPLPFLNDNISMSIEDISSISTKRAAPGKAKKKRRPKPRMAELSTEQAQAKRDANRESARKCRERKRQREKLVTCEKSLLLAEVQQLRNALAAERAKTEVLEKLLLECDARSALSLPC